MESVAAGRRGEDGEGGVSQGEQSKVEMKNQGSGARHCFRGLGDFLASGCLSFPPPSGRED